MTPEEFRLSGYAVVDWIARYMEELEDYPVLSPARPGEIRARLPPRAPEAGEPLEAMLRDLDEIVLPGVTHWQSPNFFAYFSANASAPAILGDLVSSGLGVQGMLWATSPAATELETHVLDWLVEMLDLPEEFSSRSSGGGVIQDTASSAALCALLAARERVSDFQINQRGVDRPLVAYASAQAHSSIEKAVKVAGIGRENLTLIDVDERYAMRPQALVEAIRADKEVGRIPFFVAATVGTTSSSAIDPLKAIGEICRGHHLWLHVDAAYAGSAAVCPELRFIHDGVELATSYCFNPHKWLLTNFDCDVFYVADRATLIRTLSVLPEYLKNRATESGAVLDYRDWHVPLGRRFRALKLWFVIRHYGVEGLRRHIRRHVALAKEFATWVEEDARFELAAPVPLSLVCFRHVGGDEVNQRLMDRLNASGEIYLTHTKLDDKLTLRLAICGTYTEHRHVEQAWRLIREAAAMGHPEPTGPGKAEPGQ
jgi:aromatic-L-amino-acid decarboxylase